MVSVLPNAEASALALLDLARASVKATGSGSVARLQQDLGLSYGIAAALADSLEAEGTLLPPHGDRPRMLHPRFLRQHVRDVSAAPRARYVNRMVALALFFFECHEEGHVGHSRIPGLLSPVTGLSMKVMRDFFLARCYRDQQLSLGQAALAFHSHRVEAGLTDLDDVSMADAIAIACVPHARHPLTGLTREARIDRAHLRLARCYRHMLADGVGHQSRVSEWYVPDEFVARGVSAMRKARGICDGTHTEHVVPCAFMRETAFRCLREGGSLEDVTQMTKRFLTIVDITGYERGMLDDGPESLLDVMPTGWNDGCIFARLHSKQIVFTPGPGFTCICHPDAPSTAA
jgi:hypothetical protein